METSVQCAPYLRSRLKGRASSTYLTWTSRHIASPERCYLTQFRGRSIVADPTVHKQPGRHLNVCKKALALFIYRIQPGVQGRPQLSRFSYVKPSDVQNILTEEENIQD